MLVFNHSVVNHVILKSSMSVLIYFLGKLEV